ncbi:epithelial sodium channel subunit delta [Gastrophryne carolinensis]
MEPANTEKTEEGLFEFYDSFSELFEFFCDNTTIHGTIRLNCSRRNKMKTGFWVVLYICSFGMLYFQFGDTFTKYWAYPTSLSINLQSSKTTFPGVTVCNLNPYRFEQVNEYLTQLDQMAQETLSTLYGYNESLPGNDKKEIVDLEVIMANVTSQVNERFQLDTSVKLVKLEADERSKGKAFKVGFKLCNSSGDDCFYQSFWSGVDALHEWYKFQFMNIMSKIPPLMQISDEDFMKKFILTCDFNQQGCDRNFSHFHHPTYGTCFTITGKPDNIDLWTSVKPGIQYGLTMIVKADQNDNMPMLSTVAGVKVMIHNPTQSPLVEHEGFDIWPGTETSLSLTEDQMQRLGKPYSDCTVDGSELDIKLLYNSSYTLQACLHSCFQYKMIELCGCGYYFYPLPPGEEYCNYNKHPGWGHCFYRLSAKLLDHRLVCFNYCPKQCTESVYRVSPGSAKWPSSVATEWIIPTLSSLYGYNSTSNRSELSKINIYFQELNFRSFEESPAINVQNVLSTMGNQWSFWFGSSVLSVVEIAELIFDVAALAIIITYAKHKRRQNINLEEGSQGITMNSLPDHYKKSVSPLDDQDPPSYPGDNCDFR